MRIVSTKHLKPDMIIGDDLYDPRNPDSGKPLLRKGVKLSAAIIEKLNELKLGGIYIKDSENDNSEISDIVPVKVKIEAQRNLKDLNIEKSIESAKKMVDFILESDNLSLEFMDFRTDDNYLFQHSVEVAKTSVVIAKAIGIYDKKELDELAAAALLHDIGKLCVNKDVMKRLQIKTPKGHEEYLEEMHSVYGYNLLLGNSFATSTMRNAILFHHINEDRSGFPDMPLPIEIYKFAKIIHIADAYDNLRYAKGDNSPAIAIEYLRDNTNTLFNKEIVMSFLEYAPIFPINALVLLSNGLTGVVKAQNKGFPNRPTLIISGYAKGPITSDIEKLMGLQLNLSTQAQNITIIKAYDLGNDYGHEYQSISDEDVKTEKSK